MSKGLEVIDCETGQLGSKVGFWKIDSTKIEMQLLGRARFWKA